MKTNCNTNTYECCHFVSSNVYQNMLNKAGTCGKSIKYVMSQTHECCHFGSGHVYQNMLNKAGACGESIKYVMSQIYECCHFVSSNVYQNMLNKAGTCGKMHPANLFLLCIVCLEELKINLKQMSIAFAQLLIKQQNEACGWKYLHNFYVFELTCVFTSDPPLNRKQTKT